MDRFICWDGVFAILILLPGLLAGCSGKDTGQEPAPDLRSLQFVDVTEQAGLGAFRHQTGAFGQKWFPETMGSGCGFIDYNGDGWLDIILVGGGVWEESPEQEAQSVWLYRNNGDGTFTERTRAAGLGELSAYSLGVAVADYDNDGDQDVFLTTLGRNRLLRNDDGHFTDVTSAAGIADAAEWSSSAAFFDSDRDGHLDLYVGNYVDWSKEKDVYCRMDGEKAYCLPTEYKALPDRFYENKKGRFAEVTRTVGLDHPAAPTLGLVTLDYNTDGWPDLLVANDMRRNYLFASSGNGHYTEEGLGAGIALNVDGKPRAGMGVDVGVVDSTGYPTLFVGNFSEELVGVFRYGGNGMFTNRARMSGLDEGGYEALTFGLFLFDADLDGELDLFVANGHVQPRVEEVKGSVTYRQRPLLFLNNGKGRFRQPKDSLGSFFADSLVARGAAYGDYDRDGDLDILLTENGGPVHLLENKLTGRRSLRVDFRGVSSNRDGIGAEVQVFTGGTVQRRRLRGGRSYLSQIEKTITFGLEQAKSVDSLTVRWPSGTVTQVRRLPAGETVCIHEQKGALKGPCQLRDTSATVAYSRSARAVDVPGHSSRRNR